MMLYKEIKGLNAYSLIHLSFDVLEAQQRDLSSCCPPSCTARIEHTGDVHVVDDYQSISNMSNPWKGYAHLRT